MFRLQIDVQTHPTIDISTIDPSLPSSKQHAYLSGAALFAAAYISPSVLYSVTTVYA